ncbi:MAG: WXG100 family type VII secretion target [Actinomycetes bacterium]
MGPNEQKLRQVESADAGAVTQAANRWRSMAESLEQVAESLQGRVRDGISQSWTGAAADTAKSAFSTLAEEVEDRASRMRLTASQLDRAAGALETAQAELRSLPVVPPEPDASTVDFTNPSAEVAYIKASSRHHAAAAERERQAGQAYAQLEGQLGDSHSRIGEQAAKDWKPDHSSGDTYSPGSGGGQPGAASPFSGVGGGGGSGSGPRGATIVPGPSVGSGGGPRGGGAVLVPGDAGSWTPDGGQITADAGPGGSGEGFVPGGVGGAGGAVTAGGASGSGAGLGAGAGAVAGVGGVLGGALGLSKAVRGSGAPAGGAGGGTGRAGAGVIGGAAPQAGAAGGRSSAGAARGAAVGAAGAGRAGGAVPVMGAGAGGASGGAGAGSRTTSRTAGTSGAVSGSVGSASGRPAVGGTGSAGARGAVPVTAAAGRGATDGDRAEKVDALAVEDDWFGEDEAAPGVLR